MSSQLLRHLKHQYLATAVDLTHCSGIIFLDPFFTTRVAVAPLTTDSHMLGRTIRSLRYLELQNLSTISDSIDRARMGQQFQRSLITLLCRFEHIETLRNYFVINRTIWGHTINGGLSIRVLSTY